MVKGGVSSGTVGGEQCLEGGVACWWGGGHLAGSWRHRAVLFCSRLPAHEQQPVQAELRSRLGRQCPSLASTPPHLASRSPSLALSKQGLVELPPSLSRLFTIAPFLNAIAPSSPTSPLPLALPWSFPSREGLWSFIRSSQQPGQSWSAG